MDQYLHMEDIYEKILLVAFIRLFFDCLFVFKRNLSNKLPFYTSFPTTNKFEYKLTSYTKNMLIKICDILYAMIVFFKE